MDGRHTVSDHGARLIDRECGATLSLYVAQYVHRQSRWKKASSHGTHQS